MRCPNCGEPQSGASSICEACGRPLLLPISSQQVALTDTDGREFPLQRGISRVGRDPGSNEIVLMDSSVSSRHAAIEVSARSIILRDLGSTNGTRINGELARQAVVIRTGDVIVFGNRELTVTQAAATHPRAPRGIPVPIRPVNRPEDTPAPDHLSAALAVISLTLLATMLHGVGLADGYQRDILPMPLAVMIVILAGIPLLGIGMIAASRRTGYLVTAVSAVAGLLFVAYSGPVFGGSSVRNEITAEYGSTAFWFIAIAAILALVVEILVLTASLAGWRVLQASRTPSAPATTG